jgi:hypothetical protein
MEEIFLHVSISRYDKQLIYSKKHFMLSHKNSLGIKKRLATCYYIYNRKIQDFRKTLFQQAALLLIKSPEKFDFTG